jgi:hypothetical protein
LNQNKEVAPSALQSLSVTKVLKIEELPNTSSPIDYFKEGLIVPAKNAVGFEFSSPFTGLRLNNTAPTRGEHTESFLQQHNIPANMIAATVQSTKSKL